MRPLFLTLAAFSCSLSFLRALPLSNPLVEDQLNFSALAAMGSNGQSVLPGDLDTSLCCSINGINLVEVGDCNNAPDPDTGNWYGMVTKEFSIGQYDVTARQYCNYLNEVATGENYLRFYDERMGTDPNVASIKREFKNGKNQYSIIVVPKEKRDRGAFPIVYVNLYQAARFCNWLQNKSSGEFYGAEITERGAYTLDGVINGTIARNPQAVWFLPTESEWYKAAYYKGSGLHSGYWDYPNRSNWAPYNQYRKIKNNYSAANYDRGGKTEPKAPFLTEVGAFKKSVGSYNSYDMGGNVAQWTGTEEYQGGVPVTYIARGGSWKSSYYSSDSWGISELSKTVRHGYDPSQGYDHVGFRVASTHFVNSPLPATQAPGTTEWSMGDIKNAFIGAVAAGGALAAGFGVKKIYDSRVASVEERRQEAERNNQVDLRTPRNPNNNRSNQQVVMDGGSPISRGGEVPIIGGGRLFSPSPQDLVSTGTPLQDQTSRLVQADAVTPELHSLPRGSSATAATPESKSGETLSLEESEIREIKGKIEQLLAAIPSSLQEANQTYESAFEKEGVISKDVKKWSNITKKYNEYVDNVLLVTQVLHETFPKEEVIWSAWYEKMHHILMGAIIRNHVIARTFFPLAIATQEGSELRSFSNQYTRKATEIIEINHAALNSLWVTTQDPNLKEALSKILEQQETDMIFLKDVEENVKKDSKVNPTPLNSLYLTYIEGTRIGAKSNSKNIENAACLMSIKQHEMNPVEDLCEELKVFLERITTAGISRSEGTPEWSYSPNFFSPGAEGRRCSVLEDSYNPQNFSGTLNLTNEMVQESVKVQEYLKECQLLKEKYHSQHVEGIEALHTTIASLSNEKIQKLLKAEESFKQVLEMEVKETANSSLSEAHELMGRYLLEEVKASAVLDNVNQDKFSQAIDWLDKAFLYLGQLEGSSNPVVQDYISLARAIAEGNKEEEKRLLQAEQDRSASLIKKSSEQFYPRSRSTSVTNGGGSQK